MADIKIVVKYKEEINPREVSGTIDEFKYSLRIDKTQTLASIFDDNVKNKPLSKLYDSQLNIEFISILINDEEIDKFTADQISKVRYSITYGLSDYNSSSVEIIDIILKSRIDGE